MMTSAKPPQGLHPPNALLLPYPPTDGERKATMKGESAIKQAANTGAVAPKSGELKKMLGDFHLKRTGGRVVGDQDGVVTATAIKTALVGISLRTHPEKGTLIDDIFPTSIFKHSALTKGMKIMFVNGRDCQSWDKVQVAEFFKDLQGKITILAAKPSGLIPRTKSVPKPTANKNNTNTPQEIKQLSPSTTNKEGSTHNKNNNKKKTSINIIGEHDVLLGSCVEANQHTGNIWFRQQIVARKQLETKNGKRKKSVAQECIDAVRQKGGRFLQKAEDGWVEVDPAQAIEKARKDGLSSNNKRSLQEGKTSSSEERPQGHYYATQPVQKTAQEAANDVPEADLTLVESSLPNGEKLADNNDVAMEEAQPVCNFTVNTGLIQGYITARDYEAIKKKAGTPNATTRIAPTQEAPILIAPAPENSQRKAGGAQKAIAPTHEAAENSSQTNKTARGNHAQQTIAPRTQDAAEKPPIGGATTPTTEEPEINTGRWTAEEHKLFLKGLQKYGPKQWDKIARFSVQTRNTQQVRTHAQKHFQKIPTASTTSQIREHIGRWATSEHELFLEGLQKYGHGQWESIARLVVKTRSSDQVRTHALKHYQHLVHSIQEEKSTEFEQSCQAHWGGRIRKDAPTTVLFTIGRRVEVEWNEQEIYPGTIGDVKKGKLFVEYADGHEGWEKMEDCTVLDSSPEVDPTTKEGSSEASLGSYDPSVLQVEFATSNSTPSSATKRSVQRQGGKKQLKKRALEQRESPPKAKKLKQRYEPLVPQQIPGEGRGSHKYTFEDRVAQLEAYKETHGHIAVPTVRRDPYYRLGVWLAAMRSLYKSGGLKRDRLLAFRRLGCHGFDNADGVSTGGYNAREVLESNSSLTTVDASYRTQMKSNNSQERNANNAEIAPSSVPSQEVARMDLSSTQSQEEVVPLSETRQLQPQQVHEHDVLLGRGGGSNNNNGNIRFRDIVASKQLVYLEARRNEKKAIAQACVDEVRRNGGRFLKLHESSGTWVEVCYDWATKKASQALREGLDVNAHQQQKQQQQKQTQQADSEEENGIDVGQPQQTPPQQQTPQSDSEEEGGIAKPDDFGVLRQVLLEEIASARIAGPPVFKKIWQHHTNLEDDSNDSDVDICGLPKDIAQGRVSVNEFVENKIRRSMMQQELSDEGSDVPRFDHWGPPKREKRVRKPSAKILQLHEQEEQSNKKKQKRKPFPLNGDRWLNPSVNNRGPGRPRMHPPPARGRPLNNTSPSSVVTPDKNVIRKAAAPKKASSKTEGPTEPLKLVDSLRDEDVRMGRRNTATLHPGNAFFRYTVKEHQHAFLAKTITKERKAELVMNVYDTIVGRGGRFVDSLKSGLLFEVPLDKCLLKINKALREMKRTNHEHTAMENVASTRVTAEKPAPPIDLAQGVEPASRTDAICPKQQEEGLLAVANKQKAIVVEELVENKSEEDWEEVKCVSIQWKKKRK